MMGHHDHILVVHLFPKHAKAVRFYGTELVTIRIAVVGIDLRPTEPIHTNKNSHTK